MGIGIAPMLVAGVEAVAGAFARVEAAAGLVGELTGSCGTC